MARPVWFVNLLQKAFPSRFTAARLTRFPQLGKWVDTMLFEGDDLIYLPHDRTIPVKVSIPQEEDMVLPSQVVDHFIQQANHHWIMNFCICRASSHCQEYPVEYGCLFLGEAVLDINPQLGRLVTKDEAMDHVRRCRDAGLVHMVGRNKLDKVWLGVGAGERLLTICNCCPCCCLWKILPLLDERISHKVSRMPGVSLQVTDLCAGCGTCSEGICFVDAIRLVDGRAVISEECRGCGRCVEVCPNHAIELTVEGVSYVQQTIDRIAPLVELK
jgi:ferredoxin